MKKEDILTNCIDEIQAGKSTLEECLARYPELADDLRTLLDIATNIQPEKAIPAVDFKQRAKARLLEAMQPPVAHPAHTRSGIPGWLKPPVLRPSFALIRIIVILALVIAGGTTVYASQGSLPDDTLYPIKIGVEKLQLALTRSPEARASLHLRLAQRRLDEVIVQSSLGRDVSTSALEAIATQLNAAIEELDKTLPEDTKALLSQLSGLTLKEQGTLGELLAAVSESNRPPIKQAIDAAQRGNLIAKVAYGNPAFLGSAPSVLDEKLEAAHFELEGTLLSVEDGTWNIGGILIRNINSALGIPPIGSRVEIEGMIQSGQTFISEIEHEEAKEEEVKIKGVFSGTSPDRAVWYISGIAINVPSNIRPPQEGSRIELEGIIKNGVFTIIKMETEDEEDEEVEEERKEKVEIDGVLVGIDRSEKTIVVEVAGTRVTIDISVAQIEGEDEQPLSLSDLESLVGEEIEVVGSYREDGLFRAIKVSVDVELEEESEKVEEYEAEEDHEDGEEDDDEAEADEND